MEKQIVTHQIFWLMKKTDICWSDIKHIEFQDDDIIKCYADFDEDEYLFYVQITRKELETDEEFEKRKQTLEIIRDKSKEKRYQQYLKLKEEFDNK